MRRFDTGYGHYFYLCSDKEVENNAGRGLEKSYGICGVNICNLSRRDLLEIVDIGVTFDWAKPQLWVDEQVKKHSNFNQMDWIWTYPPGDLFGQPFWLEKVYVYLWRYLIVTDHQVIRYNDTLKMYTITIPKLKYGTDF